MILAIYAVNFVLVLLHPRAFAEITEIGESLLRHIVAICGNDYSRGVFPLAADVGNYTLCWCCVHEKNNARLARYYIGSAADNSYGDVKKNKEGKGEKYEKGKESKKRGTRRRTESTWACMVIIEAVFRAAEETVIESASYRGNVYRDSARSDPVYAQRESMAH